MPTMNRDVAKPMFEVIGVVGDTKYRSLREPFQPIVYQMLVPGQGFILHLRTRGAPEAVIAPMRRLLAEIDPRLSYIEVNTLGGRGEGHRCGPSASRHFWRRCWPASRR